MSAILRRVGRAVRVVLRPWAAPRAGRVTLSRDGSLPSDLRARLFEDIRREEAGRRTPPPPAAVA